MMKTTTIAAAALLFCATTAMSCSEDTPEQPAIQHPTEGNDSTDGNETANEEEQEMANKITISIGQTAFTATLADNETARAFAGLLPTTLRMSELNGNEKYHYLDTSLPRDSRQQGTINAGDLMLYGSDCVVLFYETFNTSYSYTQIGRIDNPDGLAEAVGTGDVDVTFSITE